MRTRSAVAWSRMSSGPTESIVPSASTTLPRASAWVRPQLIVPGTTGMLAVSRPAPASS
jgi:hypothetical protein